MKKRFVLQASFPLRRVILQNTWAPFCDIISVRKARSFKMGKVDNFIGRK